MATSGSITKSFSTYYTLKIDWVINSQDATNNTSNVTFTAKLVAGSGYINSSANKNISMKINGTEYSSTCTVGIDKNQTKTLMTKTVNIPHNSDGIKSCSVSCTLRIAVTLNGSYVSSVTASGTADFNTIARASTIYSVTSSVSINGSNKVSVVWIPKSTSHYFKLKFTLGTKSETVSIGNPNTTSAYTYSYTVPTSFINGIPSATSGTMTVYLYTYSSSSYGTQIGSTSSKTLTATVPSTVVPTFTSLSASIVNANSVINGWNVAVKGYSKVKLTASGSGVYGSTISSYVYSSGYSVTTTSSEYTGGIINNSGAITFTGKVKDSRGRLSESKSATVTFYDYTKPSISSFSVLRDSSDATKINIEATFSYSSVNGKNSVNAQLYYKLKSEASYEASITLTSGVESYLTGFAENLAYDFKVVVTDSIGSSATSTKQIRSGYAFFQIPHETGFSFGKLHSGALNSFEVGWDASFYGTVDFADKVYVGRNSVEEKNIYFSNSGIGQYNHNCSIYGGNGNSKTGIGLWDYINDRCIWSYNDIDNVIFSDAKLQSIDISIDINSTYCSEVLCSVRAIPFLRIVFLSARFNVNDLSASDTVELGIISTDYCPYPTATPLTVFVSGSTASYNCGAYINKEGSIQFVSSSSISTGKYIYLNGSWNY